jgi:hypothetical protein
MGDAVGRPILAAAAYQAAFASCRLVHLFREHYTGGFWPRIRRLPSSTAFATLKIEALARMAMAAKAGFLWNARELRCGFIGD